MNNERYDMQYMCGPVCKKFHGSVTSHVTHMYEHLVDLNESVCALCLTNAGFRRDVIWICRTVRDCQLLIDRVRSLLMTSSCVTGFSRNRLLSVSFPWGWHLQIGDARRGALYWYIQGSCVGFDKYTQFNEFRMLNCVVVVENVPVRLLCGRHASISPIRYPALQNPRPSWCGFHLTC